MNAPAQARPDRVVVVAKGRVIAAGSVALVVLFVAWRRVDGVATLGVAAIVLMLAFTLACTWYAVYHLARQPAALPVAFAFGGEAQPADYARALADAGLLALVACLGLAQLSHETTPDVARLASTAALLLGAARLAHAGHHHPWRSLGWWAVGLAGLLFSGAAWLSMVLGIGLLAILWLVSLRAAGPDDTEAVTRAGGQAPRWAASLVYAGLMTAGMGLDLFAQVSPLAMLARLPWDSWARLLLWFTWPAWPLVLWTVWRWRHQWIQPHVALPLWAVLVGVAIWLAPAPVMRPAAKADSGAISAPETAASLLPQVEAIVAQRCAMCHNAALAQKGVALHTLPLIEQHAQQIYQQAVVLKAMPMNNATQITDAERAVLGRWFELRNNP